MEPLARSLMVLICFIVWDNRCQGNSSASQVVVSTRYGPMKGLTKHFAKPIGNISTVNKFLGIPYAAPPIDDLRFRPPKEPAPWKEVYDATQFKPVCYQDPYYNIMFWPNRTWPQSDDCLYLNVYAPDTPSVDARYPVMLYIHGGGYEAGSPVVSPGDALPMWGVVLVTIQYRLGPFGFISTGDSVAPGNYGMLDQIEALKWVQQNIQVFQGDPSRVTIFGESAGGSSVGLLLLSPLSKGLFHNAIALSGIDFSPFAINKRDDAALMTKYTATRLGCTTRNNAEMIECMRQVEAKQICNVTMRDTNKWRPVIDKIFLHDTPLNLRRAKKFHPYPLMAGLTSDDGSYFFDYSQSWTAKAFLYLFIMIRKFGWKQDDPLAESIGNAIKFQYTPWPNTQDRDGLRQGMINMVTDYSIAAPAHAALELHTKVAPGYLFVFSHRSKLNPSPSWKGAAHKDDTPYEFGFPFIDLNILQDYDEIDKNVSDIIITLFTNFARTGNPTPQPVRGCTWTQFNETHQSYMDIMAQPEVLLNFHRKDIAFWNNYYPKLLNTTSCGVPDVLGSTSGGTGTNNMDFTLGFTVLLIITANIITVENYP